MEGRGRTVQGRAKVRRHKNSFPSPRSGEGGPKGRMGSLPPLELSTSKTSPKGRMGSLPPLELSTEKLRLPPSPHSCYHLIFRAYCHDPKTLPAKLCGCWRLTCRGRLSFSSRRITWVLLRPYLCDFWQDGSSLGKIHLR